MGRLIPAGTGLAGYHEMELMVEGGAAEADESARKPRRWKPGFRSRD